MTPKVFISYSWSSTEHQMQVKEWADQLIADGIEVILDIYDLKEGHDKFAFMEKIVTDPSVTHVLVVSDKKYAEKADSRESGVGTESQIISREVYEKTNQSKFIPIVCEFNEDGKAYLPEFLKSRIYIDFSSLEAVNKNWEHLVRLLYGKPEHEKPALGKAPVYITSEVSGPTNHIQAKFNLLKQSILQGKGGVPFYRNNFLDECINYADEMRIRNRPRIDLWGEKVYEDALKLKVIRDHIADWILLEGTITSSDEFSDLLMAFLERLLEIKSRPTELSEWNASWFDAHSLFVYEAVLYIVAGLIKNQSYKVLHNILTAQYLAPLSDRYVDNSLRSFLAFCGHAEALQSVLAPEGKKLLSPAGEFIHRHADRKDLPFDALVEAELVILVTLLIKSELGWDAQTFYYASYVNNFPLFLRAAQHRHFEKIAVITGVSDGNALREALQPELEKWYEWFGSRFFYRRSIGEMIGLAKLDTIE